MTDSAPGTPWHLLACSDVLAQLETDASRGLSASQGRLRLVQYGLNEISRSLPVSGWAIFFGQFRNVLIAILLAAAGLSAALGQTVEAGAIAVIVILAAVLGFIQEFRAEKALDALEELTAPAAFVLRDGQESEIPARDVVPGDIIFLHTGDRIPADVRLIEVINFEVDEATLTGESQPVRKQTDPLQGESPAVGDRLNMAFAGTSVSYGRGTGVVVATGMSTQFGQIAGFMSAIEKTRTPLQTNLDRLGRVLARVALGIVAVIAGVGVLRGLPALEMFVFGIALAVAVVPEALPAVVTISLAIGVQRMARRNSLVRRLPAVETLGSVSVICTDKTGTLTRDEMTVRRIYVAGRLVEVTGSGYDPSGHFEVDGQTIEPEGPLRSLLEAAVLSSDARVSKSSPGKPPGRASWDIRGDPTEGALVVAAAKAGVLQDELEQEHRRIHEIPFSPERKRMTTLHAGGSQVLACAKGAPEVILESSSQILRVDGPGALDTETRNRVLENARSMARDALRVLAVASKAGASPADAETGMTFLGLVGLIDPPRPEARAAIQTCVDAGIRPVMITGDHPATAEAVSRELGLMTGHTVVTGLELDSASDRDVEARVSEACVFARVSPAHKLRIVSALQKLGHSVAMTGDGVNDAPALKKADIGIAMGLTGTDVAREASDVTLADDNFASIVAAVEEGRAIFENIKKYLTFLLSSNLGEILILATSALAGWPLPLTAVQILYVNLASDGLPALALAVDPHADDLMRRPPRDPRRSIFTRPVTGLIVVGGVWSGIVNLTLFNAAVGAGYSLERSRSMVLVSLVLIELFKAYNLRSDRDSVFRGMFRNTWLNLAVGWEFFLLLLVVNWSLLGSAIGTRRLGLEDWIQAVVVALTVFPVLEATKALIRRGWFGQLDPFPGGSR